MGHGPFSSSYKLPAIRRAITVGISRFEALAIHRLVRGPAPVLVLEPACGRSIPVVTCDIEAVVIVTIISSLVEAIAIPVLESRASCNVRSP